MNTNTMRAAVLYGKEDVRIETIAIPSIQKGELLIKIGAALTCGTDLKVFKRGYHASMIKPPCVFGHECAGTVIESKTDRFALGDRIVVANSAPCGTCYFCQRSQENLCADLQFINGAYAEYLRVPVRFVEKNAHLIPKQLSFAEAAMVEPLACVVHGIDETSPKAGDTVVVLGLGPIGLMFIALLRHRGCRVLGVGRHGPRLKLARELGAELVIEASEDEDWREELKQYSPLDIVIEATGKPDIWEKAIGLVRRGGLVNLFGGCPAGTKIEVDTHRLHYDQITIKASFHHRPSSVQAALDAISQGVVRPKEFISDQTSLEKLPSLLKEMVLSKKAVKTCIIP